MTAGLQRRTTIGAWRVVDFLGAGGMGEVYRAMHAVTGRIAAVKVLASTARTPAMIERFRNEGRIQSALHHPHIVALYDFFEHDGAPCIAMEYVPGDNLEQVLRRGPLPTDQALRWFGQIADAVAHVHARGIVHRDLKTNNIKIDERGQVKLLDFGIARASDSPRLTTDGSVIGTLHYLSPEQVRGETATPASDVWALGVLLYELVTGQVPFASESLTGVMTRILNGTYEPPRRLDGPVDPAVTRLIARCLHQRPDKRPAAAELHGGSVPPGPRAGASFAGLGTRWRQMAPGLRRRAPLAAAVTAAVASVVFLLSTLLAPSPAPEPPRDEPVSPAALTGGSAAAPGVRLRPVSVNVFGEAPAMVYRDGRLLGATPVRFDAPVGSWVVLRLERPGFEPLERRFQVHDGVNDYTETLRDLSPPR